MSRTFFQEACRGNRVFYTLYNFNECVHLLQKHLRSWVYGTSKFVHPPSSNLSCCWERPPPAQMLTPNVFTNTAHQDVLRIPHPLHPPLMWAQGTAWNQGWGQTLLSDSHLGTCDLNDSGYVSPDDSNPPRPFHKHVPFVGDRLFPLGEIYLGFPYWTLQIY